jgi:starch synthase
LVWRAGLWHRLRLYWQKGIDILLGSGPKALQNGASLVVLGNGEYELEQKMEALRRDFPNTMGIYIGYSNELAHKIYAGCDYFLMPRSLSRAASAR